MSAPATASATAATASRVSAAIGSTVGSAAAGAHQRGQGVRIGGDDAAGRDWLARHGDLVTGGEDGDARAAMHAEPGMVGRGGEAHVARGDAAAGGNHGVAAGEILAGAANVAAGLHRFVDPHGVAVAGRVLLQQDGVGALRARCCR